MSQAVDETLQPFLCMGGQGSVVGKEHLSQQELAHFCIYVKRTTVLYNLNCLYCISILAGKQFFKTRRQLERMTTNFLLLTISQPCFSYLCSSFVLGKSRALLVLVVLTGFCFVPVYCVVEGRANVANLPSRTGHSC